jgi:hypothetical protein
MRSIIAFFLGIAATIGVAYWHDHFSSGTAATQLVNWTQLSETSRNAITIARERWDRLTAK